MKVKINKIPCDTPKNMFVIDIETMEGDADDEHHIEIHCESEEELRDVIIHAEVMKKCYPSGRGGGDDYTGPYFEKYFADSIYCNDWSHTDSIEDYSIVHYDENGIMRHVVVDFDEEMIEEINHPKMKEYDLKHMGYPKAK